MLKIRLLSIFSLVILALTPIPIQGADPQKLDLQTSVQTALNYSLELQAEDLNLKKAELEYKKKKAENLLNQSRYSDLEAKYSLAEARNTYRNVRNNLINSVIQQYTKLYLAELDLKIKEKQTGLEKSKLEADTALHKLGDLNGIDLLEQENAYLDACLNREMAEDDLKQIHMELLTILGLKETKAFELIEFDPPDIWEVTEENAVGSAVQNSTELKLHDEESDLAEADLKRAEISISTPEIELQLKKIAFQSARIKREQKKEEIVNSTRQAYYQFKQAIKKMILLQERLEEAQKKLRLKQEEYQAEFVAATEVLQYEVNFWETNYQYQAAIADYYQKELALKQALNLETEVLKP